MSASKRYILGILFLSQTLWASAYQDAETARAMADVVKIAHAISVVQPRLEEPKYIEYAMGIYRAAKKYDIRPALIIAIAQQESSFQERLPEGKAGEIGITQVLKRWANNPKFRAEFPRATAASFKKPANSFLYSAWILRELKDSEAPGALPFWSFYNARKFKHRIKYFQRVNKHMAKLKRNLSRIEQALAWEPTTKSDRGLALMDKTPPPKKAAPVPATEAEPMPSPKLAYSAETKQPVSSYRWIEDVAPTKPRAAKPAAKRRDPREALLRSASLSGS